MAVVQISKIQVRRGKKNTGSGLPQLAGGEFGWAVDTRELYIGNGSVAEGAPIVGNTKVITEYDNLFDVIGLYTYKNNDGRIQTGSDAQFPVERTLQERLDDITTAGAFGIANNTSADQSEDVQRAVEQLFLNESYASADSRVVLEFPAGDYTVEETVYLPPNTSIRGAGIGRTIFRKTTAGPIFSSQNELQIGPSKSNRADQSGSTFNNQPANISLEGFTLVGVDVGLELKSVRNSYFKDIRIVGTWEQTNAIDTANVGIKIDSFSGAVKSRTNSWDNIQIANFAYGVISDTDTTDDTWNMCRFSTLGTGIAYGVDTVIGAPSSGMSTGPSRNTITNSLFNDIDEYGIRIKTGVNNNINNNKFVLVGNSAGTDLQPTTPVIKIEQLGNTVSNNFFNRTSKVSYDPATLINVVYVPEVEGPITWEWNNEHTINLTAGTNVKFFRLPQSITQSFDIEYSLKSTVYNAVRQGILRIVVHNGVVQITDEFDYSGDEIYLDNIKFDAILTNEDGDLTDETVSVYYDSDMPVDDLSEFTFKVRNKQS